MHDSKKEQIKNFNLGKTKDLPKDAEVCAACGIAQIVPLTSQENYLTVIAHHHYGSPRDGSVETYDICFSCFDSFVGLKPRDTKFSL
ncbi:hypothetical protein N9W84_00975 [bacterium]|nr:hypothetical protein [bacterium]